jgi:DNA-directed DNA polymerase III (polc)
MSKYGEIHLHCLDQFDSQNDPKRVVKRLAEMGAKGFVLTQHGVLSAVELMRQAAEEAGLKFIPGCEAYYDDGISICHLILISKNYKGYKALMKAVTKSNNKDGKAVMTREILENHFGPGTEGHKNIIATSACIQGVIAMKLRANDSLQKEVDKLERRRAKYIAPTDQRLVTEEADLKELNEELKLKKEERDRTKKTAETKFAFREKSLSKMAEGPEKEQVRKELERDKAMAAEAVEKLLQIKKEITALTKRTSTYEKELKTLRESTENWKEINSKMEEIKARMLPEEELYRSAVEEARELNHIFGENNFFIEIQNHRIPMEAVIYPQVAKIGAELGIPVVASNDVHLVEGTEEEYLKRNILKALRFGKWEEPSVGDSELYIKSDEELKEIISEILPETVVEKGIKNIKYIIDSCNVEFPKDEHYPVYKTDTGETSEQIFDRLIAEGISNIFPDGLNEEYQKRLEREVNVIKKMGYVDYHLIVRDFLEYGRLLGYIPTDKISEAPLTIEELREYIRKEGAVPGFTIGPGRGSAVGSLVCFLLGITSLDPLKYDLLFERFLNVERVSMPDIDSDIAKAVRPKVIEYVTNKYSKNAVCGIMTQNAQAPRGAVRIAAKYYGQSIGKDGAFLSLSDEMAKKVPVEPNTHFSTKIMRGEEEITISEMLKKDYAGNKDALEIIRWAELIEGCFTTYGAHAAGIVISDNDDVSEYVPLRWNDKLSEWTTQCDMISVEEKGLLKMDFLGLKTLDIISDALKMLNNKGVVIDPLNLEINDPKVYKDIFQSGKTNSVFQFESNGMKSMLQRFRPECFEDLIILVSMFRPGPLQFIDGVIAVKNEGKEPEYITPELEPILGKTYGAIVYQEQVMQIFQDLAGYSLGAADNVRRYMSKKKMDKLAHERETFINGDADRNIRGCVANGISEDAANKLFDQMSEFAKYAFNKSHAAAYAYNAYITGWLKCYHPAEFIAAALNWAPLEKISGLMYEAKHFGIKTLVPDINKAETGFTVVDGNIVFGLKSVKSVGSSAMEILKERENGKYTSFHNFFLRTNINKTATENLIKAGAFDCFCDNRQAMLYIAENIKSAIKKERDTKAKLEAAEEGTKAYDTALTKYKNAARCLGEIIMPVTLPEDSNDRLKEEKKLLGTFVSKSPLEDYPDHEQMGVNPIDGAYGRTKIFGVIETMNIRKRKSDGKEMAFLTINDGTDLMDVNVFTKNYEKYGAILEEGNVIILEGEVKEEKTEIIDEDGNPVIERKFFPDSIRLANKKMKEYTMKVPSYAHFHLFNEDNFIKSYGKKDGYILNIYDEALGEIRKATFTVSEDIKSLRNVV